MYSVVLILGLTTAFSLPSASASDLLLMADGVRGQGTLQKRGEECLVITPRHVVEDALSDIVATFPDRQEVIATVLELYAEDIALLRLAAQPPGGCKEKAFNDDRLSAILTQSTEGVLKRRDETGSASLLQVDVVGFDEHRLIRVEPRSSSKSIKQGFSGSVLYMENQPVGMLINNERSDSETGLVLRAETVNSTIDPFFLAAQRERTFHIGLDSFSEFLLPEIQASARNHKLVIVQDRDASTFDLRVLSEMEKLETDTDKIVDYKTRLVITDSLDRQVVDQTISASGNSFVSLSSALENAQAQLITRIRQSDFLTQLP